MVSDDITITVTVKTSVGEHTRQRTISGTCASYRMSASAEELLSYEGGKAAMEAWRTIVWRHVKNLFPYADEAELGRITRASWVQRPMNVKTKEEIDAMRRHDNVWYRRLTRWLRYR
jgi:hypothetical protein